MFKVGKELVIMGGIDVPFEWLPSYSFLTIEGLIAAKAESGMLVPVQATGQEITLLQLPKGSNAITLNSNMPKGFYYISMAIELEISIPVCLIFTPGGASNTKNP